MKIDRRDIERVLGSGGTPYGAILLYGPDEGMVGERARALTLSVAGALDDPFRVVALSEDECLSDQGRLIDEARAIAMGGGRKILRIAGSDALCPVLGPFLQEPPMEGQALLLIQAGDLGPRSPLRKLLEGAKHGAAIACYRDGAADIAELVRREVASRQMQIDADALAFLTQKLGDDRGVTRSELDKLMLYMEGEKTIRLADIMAVLDDHSAVALDDLLMAATAGDMKQVEKYLSLTLRLTTPIMIMRALCRHIARLHFCVGQRAQGMEPATILASLRPPLFWTVKARFERQMRTLAPAQLAEMLALASAGEAAILANYGAAETLCRHTVQRIALLAFPGGDPSVAHSGKVAS
ncbi:MAG TPA: DNA polymerase III subunit delta [Dongiaceae bacterium]|jgi:DNA polymerase-3 subunit delta|nr:DNA polymerase III subunit delta [Dongiaceae bacterium]